MPDPGDPLRRELADLCVRVLAGLRWGCRGDFVTNADLEAGQRLVALAAELLERVRELEGDNAGLRAQVAALAERCAAQSEALSRRAEGRGDIPHQSLNQPSADTPAGP